MALNKSFEKIAENIANLNPDELKNKIKQFQGRFKLDFSDEHLNGLSTERLRHILFAALIVQEENGN